MVTGGSANEEAWSPLDWAASDSTCIHLEGERKGGSEGERERERERILHQQFQPSLNVSYISKLHWYKSDIICTEYRVEEQLL